MYKKTIAVLIFSFSLSACENPTDTTNLENPSSTTIADPYVAVNTNSSEKIVNWLVQRYEAQPPSGGFWIISKIEANTDGEDFDVSILTTNEHAGMIMQMPPEAQFKVVSVAACPEATEDIWGMLEKDQRIILHVGGTGGVFIDVDCRRWI